MDLKTLITVSIILISALYLSPFAIAEDDHEEDEEDEHDDDRGGGSETITIIREVSGGNEEILETLDLVIEELGRLESQAAVQNATIAHLNSEVSILKAESLALRQDQDILSADIKYLNDSIAYLVSNLKLQGRSGIGAGDDDGDGVPNGDDLYPGENDGMRVDSDGDGIEDLNDLFPGENDLDYQDIDGDGVRDSGDSDLSKDTDADDDGIDDAYDDVDGRSMLLRSLHWLGFI